MTKVVEVIGSLIQDVTVNENISRCIKSANETTINQ